MVSLFVETFQSNVNQNHQSKTYPIKMRTPDITISKSVSTQQSIKSMLLQLGNLLAPHQYNDRLELLHELISMCAVGKEHDSEKLLGYMIAANLLKRFAGEGLTENLYDTSDGVSQIRLFDILIHQFPMVKYSQKMTNDAIIRLLQQQEEACIIDIGIGMGTQMLHILERAHEFKQLRKLTIIGIEPFEQALNVAAEKVLQLKEKMPFELEFVKVCAFVEHVDITRLRPLNTTCIVNASFALHHIKSSAERNKVVAGIRALQPEAFFLIEPSVNHFTDDLADRIMNCYEHFISVFRVIDRLDASNEDKKGLKLFFAREFEDIFSKTDEDRFEKHEPVSAWLRRLRENGFSTAASALLNKGMEVLGVSIQPCADSYVRFSEQGQTLLAVMHAC
jgi:ubiquinone/menaquinone biosynthesis C-methylase UbiE